MSLYATKRLLATSDGKIVDEDDENAAILVAAEGSEIPQEMVDKYNLTAKTAGVSATDPSQPQQKHAEEPANKAADAPANKSR